MEEGVKRGLRLPELSIGDTGNIVRWIVFFLGAALILVVSGSIILSFIGSEVPQVLVLLAGSLVAGLVSVLTNNGGNAAT